MRVTQLRCRFGLPRLRAAPVGLHHGEGLGHGAELRHVVDNGSRLSLFRPIGSVQRGVIFEELGVE